MMEQELQMDPYSAHYDEYLILCWTFAFYSYICFLFCMVS